MTPIVGRAAQLEQLDHALAMVGGGRLAVVEISGEPGIGKTRMLDELARKAGARGLTVYLGRGTEFEQDVPFGMYAEALDSFVPDDGGRLQIYSEVRRRLVGAALILDDLHWADRASLELTEYLIRKSPGRPLLIAIAYRVDGTPARILDAIVHLGPSAIRIQLPRLAMADLQQLLPEVEQPRRDLILRASLGNPLFVQAASRLPDGPLSAMLSDHGMHGMDDHLEMLAGLAGGLLTADREVQAVAYVAALADDQATVDLIAHAAQLPAESVISALDRLYALGLLEMDGTKCRFRHPLMRAATRGLHGPARRAAAHARIAEHLRRHRGPLQVVAYHTERSARPGDAHAALTLIAAGQSFAYTAPALASRWLATALRIMPHDGPLGEQRPFVEISYARTLGLCGELERCREVLAGLRNAVEPVRTEAETFGAVVARLRGDIDEAAAILHTRLRREHLSPAAEGRLRVQLATIDALREDAIATAAQASRALELLGPNQTAFVAAAQALGAFGALRQGHVETAQVHLARASALVDAVSDAELRPHAELFGPLAWAEIHLGQHAAAARHLARAKEVVTQMGQSVVLPYLLVMEALLLARTGRLEQALQRARSAATAAERLGSNEMRAMAISVLLRPLLWYAGPAAALEAAKRLAETGQPRSAMWRGHARLSLALAAMVAGDPRTCLDQLDGQQITVPQQVLRAMAFARIRDLPRARTAAAQAQKSAAGLPYELGLAGYGLAYVAAKAGRIDEAAALSGDAAVRLTAAGAPLDAALAHLLHGRVQIRAGRLHDGREELRRALAGFQHCDAHWLRTVAAADQDTEQPRPGNVHLLTAREQEIARLVTTGLSNQDIAERLVLSRRTVESHLSRIFAKLDVRSRTAMINALGI